LRDRGALKYKVGIRTSRIFGLENRTTSVTDVQSIPSLKVQPPLPFGGLVSLANKYCEPNDGCDEQDAVRPSADYFAIKQRAAQGADTHKHDYGKE
jgi:hypothetical protein